MSFKVNEQWIKDINRDILKTYSHGQIYTQDSNGLNAIVNQIDGGYGDIQFYPTILDQAAFLMQKLTKKHIFGDGNKRTAIKVTYLFLAMHDYELTFTNQEFIDLILGVSVLPDQMVTMQWIKIQLKKHGQKN